MKNLEKNYKIACEKYAALISQSHVSALLAGG